jgi:hypothetical protein
MTFGTEIVLSRDSNILIYIRSVIVGRKVHAVVVRLQIFYKLHGTSIRSLCPLFTLREQTAKFNQCINIYHGRCLKTASNGTKNYINNKKRCLLLFLVCVCVCVCVCVRACVPSQSLGTLQHRPRHKEQETLSTFQFLTIQLLTSF